MENNNEPQGGTKRENIKEDIKTKIGVIITATVGAVGTAGVAVAKIVKNSKHKPTLGDIIKNTAEAVIETIGKKKHK